MASLLTELDIENKNLRKEVLELKKVNYILKKAAAFFLKAVHKVKYKMIDKLKSKVLDTNLLCTTLKVGRSGYYSYKNRPESIRLKANKLLLPKIQLIYRQSKSTFPVTKNKTWVTDII